MSSSVFGTTLIAIEQQGVSGTWLPKIATIIAKYCVLGFTLPYLLLLSRVFLDYPLDQLRVNASWQINSVPVYRLGKDIPLSIHWGWVYILMDN